MIEFGTCLFALLGTFRVRTCRLTQLGLGKH
jgi:hypothetical protein